MKPTVHFKSRLALSLVISVATLLQACGGGGGGDSNSDDVSYTPNGTISGLGSIVVNGVRFETTSASVLDSDDVYGTTSNNSPLALGMTVALQGDADESQSLGRAQKIRLVGGVRGTMTAYTTGASIVVGGQTVALNANTVYADAAGQPDDPGHRIRGLRIRQRLRWQTVPPGRASFAPAALSARVARPDFSGCLAAG